MEKDLSSCRLIDLTLKELCSYLLQMGFSSQVPEPKFGYGLRCIESEFHVCHNTALKWKNTILADAVEQDAPGHKIKVNLTKAKEIIEKIYQGGRP